MRKLKRLKSTAVMKVKKRGGATSDGSSQLPAGGDTDTDTDGAPLVALGEGVTTPELATKSMRQWGFKGPV